MSTYTEEFSVAGSKIKDTLKGILREGNVRRIMIQNASGRTIIDMPLTAGVVGAALAPLWIAIAGIAALAASYKILVVRDVSGPPAPMPNGGPR